MGRVSEAGDGVGSIDDGDLRLADAVGAEAVVGWIEELLVGRHGSDGGRFGEIQEA